MSSEEFIPKGVLITGGAGFAGSHYCNYLVEHYPNTKVVCLDILDYNSSLKNLEPSKDKPNFEFVQGSINNREFMVYLLKSYEIDTILNFAAQMHVDDTFGNSLEFTKVNVLGTHVLLEAAKECGIKRFIQMSTDEVYGVVDEKSQQQEEILTPTNPYGCAKAAAEFMCQAFVRSFHMPIITVRSSTIFGPHQFPEKLIPKFIIRLLTGKKCCVHGNGDSHRNFIYIDDFVSGFDTILRRGEPFKTYNISTDNDFTVVDVTNKIIAVLGVQGDDLIEHVAARGFNDNRYHIDNTPVKQLGWEPKVELEEGIHKTVQWIRENPNFWGDNVAQYLEPYPIAYRANIREAN